MHVCVLGWAGLANWANFQLPSAGMPHTRLTWTKRFTNLKVNLKCLELYIGAKMQLVSYEFEYF